MCKKTYSVSFTNEEFLMLYTILLQINHELYNVEENEYSAECLFTLDEGRGEATTFKNVSKKFIKFEERRLMPPHKGGKI